MKKWQSYNWFMVGAVFFAALAIFYVTRAVYNFNVEDQSAFILDLVNVLIDAVLVIIYRCFYRMRKRQHMLEVEMTACQEVDKTGSQ